MSTSAWITMLISWILISYFAVRFFVKVLKSPHLMEDPE